MQQFVCLFVFLTESQDNCGEEQSSWVFMTEYSRSLHTLQWPGKSTVFLVLSTKVMVTKVYLSSTLPCREAFHFLSSAHSILKHPTPGIPPDSGQAPWQVLHRCAPESLGWQCRSVCAEAKASCWLNHCSWAWPGVRTLCWLSLPGSSVGQRPDGSHLHRWRG